MTASTTTRTAVNENHAFRAEIDQLNHLGDWQGPEPSMAMTEDSAEWRGQWLARRGTREKWTFWACVARLGLEKDREWADIATVERAARVVDVYASAARHAPASVWLVVSGRHQVWDEFDTDEDGRAYDDDHELVELLAGPFDSEDAAAEHCERHDLDDAITSIVARLPWSPQP